jgi:flagellar hook-associated protein 1 FlgK
MAGLDIGISGIGAAQKALATIGNNIANAGTEGYHRQRIDLVPAKSDFDGRISFGGGVEVSAISRQIDTLLEQEILSQKSSSNQISKELSTLKTVENTFSEFASDSSLNASIDNFFNALRDLSVHPNDVTWQRQLIAAADVLKFQFNSLGESLTNLKTNILQETTTAVENINTLAAEVAVANGKIQDVEIIGGNANNLRDQRDHIISKLSEYISVTTQKRDNGVVDVLAAGVPIVMGTQKVDLAVGNPTTTTIGLGAADSSVVSASIDGGQTGGLINLYNTLVADIETKLDTLAKEIIQKVNDYHAQGVGSDGSFTQKTGWIIADADLGDLDPAVVDGTLYMRVTTTSSGLVERVAITIDGDDTLAAAATAISAAHAGISATTLSSNLKLQISASSGYTFDFLPAPLPTPDTSTFAGSSDPSVAVSGRFTGSSNKTLTFTVTVTGGGAADVGNDTISIAVSDGSSTIATLNVGSGYVAGSRLNLGNGIYVALDTGTLTDGDTFTVAAYADTDTSGILVGTGINAFFTGEDAETMDVVSTIRTSPGTIAFALGSDLSDNANLLRLADLQKDSQSNLDNLSIPQYYQSLATSIGQAVSNKQLRQDNIEAMLLNLENRQSETSGVDVNSEATQILLYEQMFQGMARYINTIQRTLESIMSLVD